MKVMEPQEKNCSINKIQTRNHNFAYMLSRNVPIPQVSNRLLKLDTNVKSLHPTSVKTD